MDLEDERLKREEQQRLNRAVLDKHKVNYRLDAHSDEGSPDASGRSPMPARKLTGVALFQSLMQKHRIKFMTMVAFTTIANKYKARYGQLMRAIEDGGQGGRTNGVDHTLGTFGVSGDFGTASVSDDSEDEAIKKPSI